MTRIDFYILPQANTGADTDSGTDATAKPRSGAIVTACKLCDKAAAAGNRTYVFAPEAAVADALDSALWSVRQGSFIAHERLQGAPTLPLPAVLIGDAEPPAEYQGVMINLGREVPQFFSRFERVLEIVDGDAAERGTSRERYKFYRDRGYELTTHEL